MGADYWSRPSAMPANKQAAKPKPREPKTKPVTVTPEPAHIKADEPRTKPDGK